MRTLVISGSIRSIEKNAEYVLHSAQKLKTISEYISDIEAYQKRFCPIANSEILAGAVLLGMKSIGAQVDYFPLKRLFPRMDMPANNPDDELGVDTLSLDSKQLERLKARIASADGIVLVSPTYFGDRSSVANKLFQIIKRYDLIKNKVFGAVSVGAKRNGGQETTIIYSLFEALNQYALVVGNSPPTAQYGGTAVGGKKGSVIRDDNVGLETSFGTGARVAHVSNILNNKFNNGIDEKIRVSVLVTIDNKKQFLYLFLKDYLKRLEKAVPNVEFRLENVLKLTIYRCLACDTCPQKYSASGEHLSRPRCVIKNSDDGMESLRKVFSDSDGIVIAGLNISEELVYRYQVLMERTRYIRRNNFELTNKLITAFCFNQVGSENSLHSLKTITSYIRHNSIIHKPIEVFMHKDKIISDGVEDFKHFVRCAEKIAAGVKKVSPLGVEYVPKGYC